MPPRCWAFSGNLGWNEYRPAEQAFGHQVVKLYQQLGNDTDTMPGSPSSGYHSLDAQLPSLAPGVTDAWGDHQGCISALAGDVTHRSGENTSAIGVIPRTNGGMSTFPTFDMR